MKDDLLLWKKLEKQLAEFDDNNFAARKLYDYIQKYYKRKK